MKAFYFLLSAFLLLISAGCDSGEEGPLNNDPQATGYLSLGFSNNKSGNKLASSIEPVSVLVSIEKTDDSETIFTNERIELQRFGTEYLTAEIELGIGEYEIVGFNVQDSENNVILSAPIQGSKKAELVNQPLPIKFTITSDGTTSVKPEVLSVEEGSQPEEYGYFSLGFELIETISIPVAAFETDTLTGETSLTSAALRAEGTMVFFDDAIEAKTHWIELRHGEDSYIFTFSKEGYAAIEITLTGNELENLVSNGNVLKVFFK